MPPEVPQVLINKEHLRNLNFDVELLGDCDTIVGELCRRLGDEWAALARTEPMTQITRDDLPTPPASPTREHSNDLSMDSETGKKLANNPTTGSGSKNDSCSSSKENQGSIEDKSSCDTITSTSTVLENKPSNTETSSPAHCDVTGECKKQSTDDVEKTVSTYHIECSEKIEIDEKEKKMENGSLGEPKEGTSSLDDQSVSIEVARSWWQPSKYNLANKLEGKLVLRRI